jgi:mycothiol system anti-sigma-R factor
MSDENWRPRSAPSIPTTRSARRWSPRFAAARRRGDRRDRERLQQHLDECPTCLRHYGLEERIKKLIATKCSGEKAPQYLLERVRLEISRTTIIRRG